MACGLAFQWPAVATAAPYGGATIHVINGQTRDPVAGALVFLDSVPTHMNAQSDQGGTARILDVPAGPYSLTVTAAGYKMLAGQSVTIERGPTVTDITVTIVPETAGPRVIATVQSRRVRPGQLSSLSDLPPDLSSVGASALSQNPWGAVPQQAVGATLNGAPLGVPRLGSIFNAVDPDLIQSQTFSGAPQDGFSGGIIQGQTVYPTLYWNASDTQGLSSFTSGYQSAVATGTPGFTGVAFQYANRTVSGPLNGASYFDSSGSQYTHSQGAFDQGALFAVQGSVGAQQLSSFVAISGLKDDLICTTLVNGIPCGYGPNNTSSSSSVIVHVQDGFESAGVDFAAAVDVSRGSSALDENNLVVNGALQPFQQNGTQNNQQVFLQAARAFGSADLLEAKVQYSHGSATTSSATQGTSSTTAIQAPAFALTGTHYLSPRLALAGSLSEASSGTYKQNDLGLSLSDRLDQKQSFALYASQDWNSAQIATLDVALNPYTLQFDCSAQAAYGTGPSLNQSGTQRTDHAGVAYARETQAGGVQISSELDLQQGVAISAPVSAAALTAYLPSDYVTIAQQLFSSPAGCGGTGALRPGNIFLTTTLPNAQTLSRGVQLTAYRRIGRHVRVSGEYDTRSVIDTGVSQLIVNTNSTIIAGSQLPNIPLHQASLSVTYGNSGTMAAVLSFRYTGSNNPNNLPGYTEAEVGASGRLGTVELTGIVHNLFNTYPGSFTSPAHAIPLATNSGAPQSTLAQPLGPRTYALLARFDLGRLVGAPATSTSRVSLLDVLLGGHVAGWAPLNSRVMNDPFAIDRSRAACTPAIQERLEPTQEALRALMASGAASGVAGRVVATRFASIPGAYYLTQLDPWVIVDLQRCSVIHAGNLAQAAKLGLPVPPPDPFSWSIGVSASEGYYAVFDPEAPQPGSGSAYRVYDLGTPMPDDAFVIESRCPAALRSRAAELVDGVRRLIVTPGARSNDDWSIQPHAGGIKTWFGLVPHSAEETSTLLLCAHVTSLFDQELSSLHVGALDVPAVNYADGIGLYVLKH